MAGKNTVELKRGDWTLLQTYTDVDTYREFISGSWGTTFQGGVDVNFNGTWTAPLGSRTVNKTFNLQFSRQRTVTISADGKVITIDIETGQEI